MLLASLSPVCDPFTRQHSRVALEMKATLFVIGEKIVENATGGGIEILAPSPRA
jgi:hypothetical protein